MLYVHCINCITCIHLRLASSVNNIGLSQWHFTTIIFCIQLILTSCDHMTFFFWIASMNCSDFISLPGNSPAWSIGNWAYFILTQLPAREDDRPGGGPRYTLPRYSPYLMATQVLDWGREHDPQGRPPSFNGNGSRNDFGVGFRCVYLDFFGIKICTGKFVAFGIPT